MLGVWPQAGNTTSPACGISARIIIDGSTHGVSWSPTMMRVGTRDRAERRLQLRHRPSLGHHLAREVSARAGIVFGGLAEELGEAARVLGS